MIELLVQRSSPRQDSSRQLCFGPNGECVLFITVSVFFVFCDGGLSFCSPKGPGWCLSIANGFERSVQDMC